MSWSIKSLGDICDEFGGKVQTGPFGSQLKQNEYVDIPDGISVVMPKDIKNGKIDDSEVAKITINKANDLSRHLLSEGDVVFPRRGAIDKCAYIDTNDKYLCGTGCLKIHMNNNELKSKYLFYFLSQTHISKWLEGRAIGSTMLNLNTKLMRSVPIKYPKLNTQKRIVSILSAYDEFIQNNKRRIELLEKSARLLYKEWFIQLRFPGHEHTEIVDGVPEGWEKKKVKDVIMKVRKPKKVKKGDYLEKGEIPCIDQGQEFLGGYLNDNDAAIPTSDLPLVVFGDHSRTLKYVDFTFAPGADGTQLLRVKGNLFSEQYLYFLLMAIDLSNYFYARHFKFLKEKEFLLPTGSLRKLFEAQAIDVLKQIGLLRLHNQKLMRARDLLLSKLMNGEITV